MIQPVGGSCGVRCVRGWGGGARGKDDGCTYTSNPSGDEGAIDLRESARNCSSSSAMPKLKSMFKCSCGTGEYEHDGSLLRAAIVGVVVVVL